jgi:hypothetical protein
MGLSGAILSLTSEMSVSLEPFASNVFSAADLEESVFPMGAGNVSRRILASGTVQNIIRHGCVDVVKSQAEDCLISSAHSRDSFNLIKPQTGGVIASRNLVDCLNFNIWPLLFITVVRFSKPRLGLNSTPVKKTV